MERITKVIDWFGRKIRLSWIPLEKDADLSAYNPLTQAYGVCFNYLGEILILDQTGDGSWTLPGGTIEAGETPADTLIRELGEEADITVKNITLIGIQKVDDPQNSNSTYHSHYQVRYSCLIDQILPQTPDPDKGRVHIRKFVPAKNVTNYVRWGKTGRAIFAKATDVFFQLTRNHGN